MAFRFIRFIRAGRRDFPLSVGLLSGRPRGRAVPAPDSCPDGDVILVEVAFDRTDWPLIFDPAAYH